MMSPGWLKSARDHEPPPECAFVTGSLGPIFAAWTTSISGRSATSGSTFRSPRFSRSRGHDVTGRRMTGTRYTSCAPPPTGTTGSVTSSVTLTVTHLCTRRVTSPWWVGTPPRLKLRRSFSLYCGLRPSNERGRERVDSDLRGSVEDQDVIALKSLTFQRFRKTFWPPTRLTTRINHVRRFQNLRLFFTSRARWEGWHALPLSQK